MTTCLDSPKTGLRAVYKSNIRKYNKKLPESLSKDDGGSQECHRPPRLGKSALDAPQEHDKKIRPGHNEKYEMPSLKAPGGPNDLDLIWSTRRRKPVLPVLLIRNSGDLEEAHSEMQV